MLKLTYTVQSNPIKSFGYSDEVGTVPSRLCYHFYDFYTFLLRPRKGTAVFGLDIVISISECSHQG